jgi:hypothetical protein
MGRQLLTAEREQWRGHGALDSMLWTQPQRDLFASPYRLTVSWGANAIGKSVGLAGLAAKALKAELYWQRPGPGTIILAGKTWPQLGSTIKWLWQFIDPAWFSEKLRYEAGGVKGQRMQVFDIISGPKMGGELRLGVFNAENLAGPRAEFVGTDEPLPESVHNELWPRLLGRGGRMYETFTPTEKSTERLGYLWDMVDDPNAPWIGQIHTPLTMEAVTPVGGMFPVPWISRAEIEQFESGLSARVRDMRMGRTRSPQKDTAQYSAWGPHLILDEPPRWWRRAVATQSQRRMPLVGIGMDHGSKPGAQRATMAHSNRRTGLNTRIWIPDEYKSTAGRSEYEDAQGVLDMLERQDLEVKDVDIWVGDRAHAGDKKGGAKSNLRFQEAMAKMMGIDTNRRRWSSRLPINLREMRTPYKYDNSPYEGADIIHRLMLRGDEGQGDTEFYAVHSRCVHLDEDHREWQGGPREPAKDGCDSERYIVVPMVEGKKR